MNKILTPLIIGVVAVCVITWLGWQEVKAQGADWLPIKFVRIEGAFQYIEKDTIKKVLIEQVNKGLYNADIHQIQQSVKHLEWINDVNVKRVWPDAIDIKIVEQTPVVRWGDKELLNQSGEIFKPNNINLFSDLPKIIGPSGKEKYLLAVMEKLEFSLKKKSMALDEIHIDDRRAWKVVLQNKMQLKLGRNDPLNKLERFLNTVMLLGEEQVSKVSIADLRYPNGYAIAWKQGSEEIDWKKVAEMKKIKAN